MLAEKLDKKRCPRAKRVVFSLSRQTLWSGSFSSDFGRRRGKNDKLRISAGLSCLFLFCSRRSTNSWREWVLCRIWSNGSASGGAIARRRCGERNRGSLWGTRWKLESLDHEGRKYQGRLRTEKTNPSISCLWYKRGMRGVHRTGSV